MFNMKKVVAVGIAVSLAFGSCFYTAMKTTAKEESLDWVQQEVNTEETTAILVNPDRGFYRTSAGYKTGKTKILTKEEVTSNCAGGVAACNEIQSTLIYMAILIEPGEQKEYSITAEDKANLKAYFTYFAEEGLKVIPRATYDVAGTANKEPDSIDKIKENVDDICEVYNECKDCITLVQYGLFGPWGEMHTSKYITSLPVANLEKGYEFDGENLKIIANEYLSHLDDSLQISVRRPSYYRAIFDTKTPFDSMGAVAKGSSYESRVGIYNDGYLATESDYGTYSLWNRSQELAFQDVQNQNTLFGGEAICNVPAESSYGATPKAAVEDMTKTHCTYINYEWNQQLHNLWKVPYLDTGINGYEYIRDHLGYRFLLTSSSITLALSNGQIGFHFAVKNVGFGNAVRNQKAQLVFQNGENIKKLDIDVNPASWNSGTTTNNEVMVSVPDECKAGTWNVYLRLPDRYLTDTMGVKFANASGYSEEIQGICLGKYTDIKEATTEEVQDEVTYPVTIKRAGTTYKIYKNKTAKVVKGAKKKIVNIPSKISYEGKKYKVVRVESKAFYKNKKVKKVVIGKNVKELGRKAFYGCCCLREVVIKSDDLFGERKAFDKKTLHRITFVLDID